MLDCEYCSKVQAQQSAKDLSSLLKALNEQMDVWIAEYCSLGISDERKHHLWFTHLLPTEEERVRILKHITSKKEVQPTS